MSLRRKISHKDPKAQSGKGSADGNPFFPGADGIRNVDAAMWKGTRWMSEGMRLIRNGKGLIWDGKGPI